MTPEDARMNNEEREQTERCGITFEQAGLQTYQYGLRKSRGDTDKAADFYLRMVPMIRRMFDRYIDKGAPFSSYLFRTLKWQWYSFVTETAMRQNQIAVADTAEASHNTPPHEIAEAVQPRIDLKKTGATERRGLFYLALSLPEIDSDKLAEISRVSGVPVKEIVSHADALTKDYARADSFRARRDKAFARLLAIDYRIADEVDPEKKARLAKERDAIRRRLHKANERLAKTKTAPTHAEIAQEVGVPKGTVDSSVFWLLRSRTKQNAEK